jgi:hypothetical protein
MEEINKLIQALGIKIEDDPKCLHRSCPECHGTGKRQNGVICVHYISCPCKRCSWVY